MMNTAIESLSSKMTDSIWTVSLSLVFCDSLGLFVCVRGIYFYFLLCNSLSNAQYFGKVTICNCNTGNQYEGSHEAAYQLKLTCFDG